MQLKTIERGKIDTSNTHMYHCSLSWFAMTHQKPALLVKRCVHTSFFHM
jgi:hypothetical protein